MSHRLVVAFSSLAFLAALIGAFLALRAPADAAPIAVDVFTDELNTDGDCSLREAITAANQDVVVDDCAADSGADTITLPAGTYTLTITGPDEEAAVTGDLDVTDDLTINGAGAGSTIIEACAGVPCAGVDRVFDVLTGTVSISGVTIRNGAAAHGSPFLGNGGGIQNASGSTLTLTSSTVSGNSATGGGGGIRNSGTMTLTNSTVSGNTAGAGSIAGGIRNDGTLTLTNSTVSGNMASTVGGVANNNTLTLTNSTVSGNTATNFDGAGIFNNSAGTATITNSTVSGNTAAGHGGGVRNDGALTLANSTVSGNTSGINGGGIFNFGTTAATTITNSTISNNTADNDASDSGDGGGIFWFSGTVNLKNTILAGNHDLSAVLVEPDCFGELTSQGYNLIQTISVGCLVNGDTVTNVTGQSANLAPLALNAPGTTETHAIQAGSPAIDFASADCPPPATDQRGVARPDGNRCDIGSYESSFSGPTPVPTPVPSPTPTPSPSPTSTPTPTATATGAATPTPTATATGETPTPSGSPGSVTPTGSVTATPSDTGPTDTPTSSPDGGLTVTWGDDNCSGEADPVDSLLTLRHDAGLGANTGDCPDFGDSVALLVATALTWGDVDCSTSIDPVDSLKLLRYDAGLSVSQEAGCPELGEQVTISTG
ncbi:MAG: right-handed parallel beta-helix repeat-containing protein [Dehalococcoidia bacterium]